MHYGKYFNTESGTWTKECTDSTTQRADFKFDTSEDSGESEMEFDGVFSFHSDHDDTEEMNEVSRQCT